MKQTKKERRLAAYLQEKEKERTQLRQFYTELYLQEQFAWERWSYYYSAKCTEHTEINCMRWRKLLNKVISLRERLSSQEDRLTKIIIRCHTIQYNWVAGLIGFHKLKRAA